MLYFIGHIFKNGTKRYENLAQILYSILQYTSEKSVSLGQRALPERTAITCNASEEIILNTFTAKFTLMNEMMYKYEMSTFPLVEFFQQYISGLTILVNSKLSATREEKITV